MKGQTNAYFCPECGVGIVTIDRDEGVTPYMLGCRATPGCKGMSRSSFYRPPPDAPPPMFEWYRASEDEAKAAGPGMYHHHEQGGLFIRKIAAPLPATTTKDNPE